jgi:hypothetical protein
MSVDTIVNSSIPHKVFGPKRDEVTGPSPSITRMVKSRRMRLESHVARIGAKGNAYRISVGKPEGKRPVGGPRCR